MEGLQLLTGVPVPEANRVNAGREVGVRSDANAFPI